MMRTGTDKIPANFSEPLSDCTAYSIAARLNNEQLIQRVAPGQYVVQGTSYSESRIVNVIPKAFSLVKCSCPGTALCPHVVGVQMFLGCHDHDTKKPKNTGQTRRRGRKAADKTSGRKQPRTKDTDRKVF